MYVPEKTEIWLEQCDETSVKMVIIGDGWRIEDNIFAYDGDTVLSILEEFTERNGVSFEHTYWEQFDSVLIDSINNDVNGEGGKYWQYYVSSYENGEAPPMKGCDKYEVSNGDYVEWRFELIFY